MSTDTTTTDLQRLPHTSLRVPHNRPWTVTSLKQHRTHDGVAFVATVRLNNKIVGQFENSGNGGGTYLYPHPSTPTDQPWHQIRDQFEQFAATCTLINGKTADVENVADDLITEFETTRDLTKAAKTGNTIARFMQDHQWGDDSGTPMFMPAPSYTLPVPTRFVGDLPALAAQLTKTFPDLTTDTECWWQIWDGTRWADVTTRPAHLTDLL